MDAAPIVTLTAVVKQFGRFAALRGVSAEFAPGQLYAILGDNGAGKTTLLRALAGLAQPTRGSVSILGTTELRSVCHELGYMAHPSLLYDEMSGMENLRYFGRLYGIADDRNDDQPPDMTAVGLDPALSRPVAQYSQGMRQRLSLARALLNDPKILLLDEPFSNVDAGSAREMVALLARMRNSGKTIFVVTHQASLLEGVADEFVEMEAGPDYEPLALRPYCGQRRRDEPRHLGDIARDVIQRDRSYVGQRLAPGVAIERRHQLHAVLFPAGGGGLQFFLRSQRRRIAPDRRRTGLGSVSLCRGGGAQPDLGARTAQSGSGRLSGFARPGQFAFPGQGAGQLYFCRGPGNPDDAAVHHVLQAAGARPGLAADSGRCSGNVGLVVNGTFFAAMSLRTRSREIMLPLLLFPVSIPALLAMVNATTAILTGELSARFWIVLLTTYDVVFTIACLLLFELVLNAE